MQNIKLGMATEEESSETSALSIGCIPKGKELAMGIYAVARYVNELFPNQED